MLAKLIKYDLKAISRFLIIIHAFLIFTSVLIRLFFSRRFFTESTDYENPSLMLPGVLLFALIAVLIVAVSLATQLIIAMRFYRNLFSDEGYLSHTLPVTGGQHLLAKTISGTVWGILDIILLHIFLLIAFATPYLTGLLMENLESILEELGFAGSGVSPKTLFLFYILTCLVSTIMNVILFYASIAIGQLISGHKILGAVAAYFAISTASSIVTMLILAVSGLLGASINPSPAFSMPRYLKHSLVLGGILSAAESAILYAVTYWIMRKKINLD